jgi:catechol 2,3-dioxygenase-like lactoylglutathione lyase family enzyme
MEVRAADFIGYTVTDLDRSSTFYRDVLGLKPTSSGDGWAEFDLNNVTLSIFVSSEAGAAGNGVNPGGGAVAIAVPDVPAAVEELRGKGVPVVFDTMDFPSCQTAMVADPDGNRIYLHHRSDGTAG